MQILQHFFFDGPICADSNGKQINVPNDYVNWKIIVKKQEKIIWEYQFNAKGKNVLMNFLMESPILGDTVMAMSHIEKFREKHGCKIYVTMFKDFVEFFQRAYPEITFISSQIPKNFSEDVLKQLPDDIYATYNLNWYTWKVNKNLNSVRRIAPIDMRSAGLSKYMSVKLGVDQVNGELSKKFLPSTSYREIKEPYVCISGRASRIQKEWVNENGWAEVTKYLKSLGYRVICVDALDIKPNTPLDRAKKVGLEDFSGINLYSALERAVKGNSAGFRPLQETVNLIYYADFFIGLASGLSWLAWGTGKPVIMISGFTLPHTEFYTPYRVTNYHFCNGCWNDIGIWNKYGDGCPCEKKENYLDCSYNIYPEMVRNEIDKLMQDYHLTPPNQRR